MAKKWLFAAGAVGYVLGTRAGRQRYEQMKAKAQEVLDRPEVKDATAAVQAEATRIYDEGRQLIRDKMRDIRVRSEHRADVAAERPDLAPTSRLPITLDRRAN